MSNKLSQRCSCVDIASASTADYYQGYIVTFAIQT